jgi:NADH dehydrogenase FAD-containing subunit
MDFRDVERNQKNIEKSKTICVVGTGPTGTEYLGEISTKYPKKEYSIISQSSDPLTRFDKKAKVKRII